MRRDFQRIAIIDCGEAAMRFIHAAREFNQEHDTSLRTIALFTEGDRHAIFVREADEAVSLDGLESAGPRPEQCIARLDLGRLERALTAARAEAVWAGWGHAGGHAQIADLCEKLNLVFIGPDGDAIRLLGNKISAKLLAERLQIPVVPWGGEVVETLVEALRHAERIGYPLLFKPVASGSGAGVFRADSGSDVPRVFERARAEAWKACGDPNIFAEKLVEGARQIEVQVIADHYGTAWALGTRDCTAQLGGRKIVREAPARCSSAEDEHALCDVSIRLCQAAGYRSAGTVQFLYEPLEHRYLFLEMNPWLDPGHPLTELTSGFDLVKLQIHVARCGPLEGEPPATTGHAVEVQLRAEDPYKNFVSVPGTLQRFKIFTGPGVRVDTGLSEGDCLSAECDLLIANIVGHGRNRDEALARVRRVIRGSVVVIQGGGTNKAFLLDVLHRDQVQHAKIDTGWLDRFTAGGEHLSQSHADVALLLAAIEAYDAELSLERTQFYASALRGRPYVRSEMGRMVELRYCGHSYSPKVYRTGPQQYRVVIDSTEVDCDLQRLDAYECWLTCFGRRFRVVSVVEGATCQIEVEGVLHRIDRGSGGLVCAPGPAVVVSVAVKAGDTVSAGDRIAVLEAMKMEMQVLAPASGRVRQVMAIPNVQVDAGTPLLQIESTAADHAGPGNGRILITDRASRHEQVDQVPSRCMRTLAELRQLMLGFDLEPKHTADLLADWREHCETPGHAEQIRRAEDEILNIFADICALFRTEPQSDDQTGGEGSSAEVYLFSYLRMLDTAGQSLPAAFLDSLRRALAHYGVRTLECSPELQDSLLWIYRSHQRIERQIEPIRAVLERRLQQLDTLAPQPDDSFYDVLERIISMTRDTYPAVCDLAQEVRYRYFQQPVFERARTELFARAEEHLDYLSANPGAADREQRVRELVDCPQPLVSLFSRRLHTASPEMRRLMLEVLTWRYYRIRSLRNCRSVAAGEYCCVTAEYDHEDRHIHVFTTHTELSGFPEALCAVSTLVQQVPAEHDVVLDVYTWRDGASADSERLQQELQDLINAAGPPRPVRRIVIVVGDLHPGRAVQHFTYRPAERGYKEDRFYRGVHPLIGARLHLWRLNNFQIERLPSVDDVYLLRVIARDNPKDERLFACAEVRDLTPVRDERGRLVQLPHFERMFAEAAAGIRFFQSRRAPKDRLFWNRLFLYLWPPLDLKPNEFDSIVHKLAPMTDGLGLEQVVVRARIPDADSGELKDTMVRISSPGGSGLVMTFRPAGKLQSVKPLTEYDQKVVRMRRRGLIYPYEIVRMLTPSREHPQPAFPAGDFSEYDLDAENDLVPVDRPQGQNKSNIIVGVIRNYTSKHPEGMSRVVLLGDPSMDLGALAEPECRRIIAALDLAQKMEVPLEWFTLSAGARISMDSGVENMDWIARVLRRIIEFTQAGGEINLVVNGINVGAQPYWNAEATMLMHTRGILIMTSTGAMVLTGKRALDYSGSVSAEDNFGIGGYDRIMGLNGQAQYWAHDIGDACQILFRHYDHTYVVPGERFPRRAVTTDPIDRDVRTHPYSKTSDTPFNCVGEILSDDSNPGRKKAFDIRQVMSAVIDEDHVPLERWAGMRAAETAVIWDAHLGGYPVCLIGIESRPVQRLGFVPADGPDQWTAGTLFPLSSKKIARAINAASDNRPVVFLANLSGFDGSPESMRRLQLEYGAEIGRAVVNFKGPMVFCVISRYHGGAYVVFSRALNENLEVVALAGTYASVIGGAPAAAVVFAGEVDTRARKDTRLVAISNAMAKVDGMEKSRLRAQWNELYKLVYSEKLGEVAGEFDRIHNVERALRVGALDRIISPSKLRPYLIGALERKVCGLQVAGPEAAPAKESGSTSTAA